MSQFEIATIWVAKIISVADRLLRKLSGVSWIVKAALWYASRLPLARLQGASLGILFLPLNRGLCPDNLLLSRLSRLRIVTWLILPVVICLSQRLSHACLSISNLYGETANGSLNQL
jgi:hypothetical protein